MRAARTTAIHLADRSTDGRLRLHRGMVQPPSTSPEPGPAVAYQLRKITSTWACGPKPVTVHQGGTTPAFAHRSLLGPLDLETVLRVSSSWLVRVPLC